MVDRMSTDVPELAPAASVGRVRLALSQSRNIRILAVNFLREVTRFIKQHSDTPVYIVNVVQDRSLSRQLADDLGVRHESPQTILMQSGEATKHASHREITAQLLEGWAASAAS